MSKTTNTALMAMAALSIVACTTETIETGIATAVGGSNVADIGENSTVGSGGRSQQSRASTSKGGSSQNDRTVGSGGSASSSSAAEEETSVGGTRAATSRTSAGGTAATSSDEEGGETSAGGTSSTTGTKATGGTSSMGGTKATGGSSSTGGTKAAGGTSSTGGTKAAGGTSSTGGTKAAGGTSSTGGTKATGGTSAKGGAASGGAATGGTTSNSNLEKFSFFVTSYDAMKLLSGNELGFGGDLRYGQSTGLAGADKICAEIAESSMPGAGAKGWRAFLSTSSVNAIDRITYDGPFYDRRGRVVATSKAGLISGDRPAGADSSIANDLPNENGIANHAPDGTKVDNHDVLTGSTNKGVKTGSSCQDWTDKTSTGSIQIGHSWPAHGDNWLQAHTVNGCKPGVTFLNNPNAESGQSGTVGNMGGYGGIYCIALQS